MRKLFVVLLAVAALAVLAVVPASSAAGSDAVCAHLVTAIPNVGAPALDTPLMAQCTIEPV